MELQGANRTRTILLAEDEYRLRTLLVAVLQAPGICVIDAANGCEALGKAMVYGADIDLLVSDVEMPILGGIELAERLQREHPELNVLLISGTDASATAAKKGWGFLAKPFGMATFNAKVEAFLKKESAPWAR